MGVQFHFYMDCITEHSPARQALIAVHEYDDLIYAEAPWTLPDLLRIIHRRSFAGETQFASGRCIPRFMAEALRDGGYLVRVSPEDGTWVSWARRALDAAEAEYAYTEA